MTISFAQYKELPKKEVNKKYNLTPGKKYYIQDTSSRNDNHKTVFIGVYTHQANGYNHFNDVDFLVSPFGRGGKPHAFNTKSGSKFLEVIDFNPTELDFKNKNRTLTELHEFIHEKRAEPHDSTPPISFMGEDYRKAKHTFYNRSRSSKSSRSRSSRSRSRSSSRSSSSKKGGRKNPKSKTTKRHKK